MRALGHLSSRSSGSSFCAPQGHSSPVSVLIVGAFILPDRRVALNLLDGASAHLSDVCFKVRPSPLGHLSGLQTFQEREVGARPLVSAGSSTPRVEQARSPRLTWLTRNFHSWKSRSWEVSCDGLGLCSLRSASCPGGLGVSQSTPTVSRC